MWQIRQDMREIQEKMIMDIEIEKKIEQLEWQRDNAMRIRCPLVARKYQRMIDELAKESRNKSMINCFIQKIWNCPKKKKRLL